MKELTKHQIRVLSDFSINPFSFLKHVKIQEPGNLAVDYQLWEHLLKFYRALEIYKYLVVLKAKQVGVSWALAIRELRKIYTTPGSNRLMLSSGQKESQKLLGKVKIIYRNLPEWMQIWTPEPDSGEQFGFKEIDSLITALPSTEKAGIGETSDGVIHDEAAFHDFFEINLSHTMATVADKQDRQLVVVSTTDPEKPDSPFNRLYRGAKDSGFPEEGTNNFQSLFFAYNSRPDRDERFLDDQKKQNLHTPWVVDKNYPITAEQALSPITTQSCFNKDVLMQLWENSEPHPKVEQGYIYILCPFQAGTQYVAGVDVGEGVGLDYSVLSIVGKRGLSAEVSVVIYSNAIGTDSFAFDVDRKCREYGNPPLYVDNIGVGRAVIDTLERLGYPNLYKDGNKKAGWYLSRPIKRELAVKLVERINNQSLITRFRPQVQELMEYQWVNGYPEPTGKTHGDSVISLMLACAELDKIGQSVKPSYWVGGKQIW